MADLTQLEDISKKWMEMANKQDGEIKELSNIINELLIMVRTADKLGYTAIAGVLYTLLVAIDASPDDVMYLNALLYEGYWSSEEEEELKEGDLNLFNEDGTRVNIKDLDIISE